LPARQGKRALLKEAQEWNLVLQKEDAIALPLIGQCFPSPIDYCIISRMGKQLLLTIPDEIYQRAERVAYQTDQDMNELVAESLAMSLPVLEERTPDPEVQLEAEAFRRLHPTLRQNYPGEYVAIFQQRLIDHDPDLSALFKRIEERYPDTFVIVRPVREEPEIVYQDRSIRWA
jgi:hypothetical protein